MMVLVFALVFGVCLVLASGVCIMVAQNMATSETQDINGTIQSCLCTYVSKEDTYNCKCDVQYDDGTTETVKENSTKSDGKDLMDTTYVKASGDSTQEIPQWLYIVAISTFLSGLFISGFAMVSMHGFVSSPSVEMGPYYKI